MLHARPEYIVSLSPPRQFPWGYLSSSLDPQSKKTGEFDCYRTDFGWAHSSFCLLSDRTTRLGGLIAEPKYPSSST